MESTRPKVSICIPTYKQVEFLKKTLDSILIQSYQDYEIIISDDSPDRSVQSLVEQYSFGSKLKFLKNKNPLGSPENWNESIRKASGEYMKILHHDDWFTFPYSLEEYVKLLDENPQADFAFSATNVFHADTLKERIHCIPDGYLEKLQKDPQILFWGNLIGGPSVTICRRSLNEYYDKKMQWLVDIEFYIRAIQKNSHIVFSPKPLITTSTATEHAITSSITKEIDVSEHFYLYDKIKSSVAKNDRKPYIIHLWYLLEKYNITSPKQVKQMGYSGELERPLKTLMTLKIISFRLSQLYQKIYFF
ncbi:MAG TPA: glycosyltransferase [Cytophagaceae bacterium]|nr:glycosyltransferase [Cytophagaceae bacterium]